MTVQGSRLEEGKSMHFVLVRASLFLMTLCPLFPCTHAEARKGKGW